MRAEAVGKLIGYLGRFIGGAVAFGIWQHSVEAGVFAFFALITLEPN
jgi:hypothetical protein